jgi:hypothetical protein
MIQVHRKRTLKPENKLVLSTRSRERERKEGRGIELSMLAHGYLSS